LSTVRFFPPKDTFIQQAHIKTDIYLKYFLNKLFLEFPQKYETKYLAAQLFST